MRTQLMNIMKAILGLVTAKRVLLICFIITMVSLFGEATLPAEALTQMVSNSETYGDLSWQIMRRSAEQAMLIEWWQWLVIAATLYLHYDVINSLRKR